MGRFVGHHYLYTEQAHIVPRVTWGHFGMIRNVGIVLRRKGVREGAGQGVEPLFGGTFGRPEDDIPDLLDDAAN